MSNRHRHIGNRGAENRMESDRGRRREVSSTTEPSNTEQTPTPETSSSQPPQPDTDQTPTPETSSSQPPQPDTDQTPTPETSSPQPPQPDPNLWP
nr:acidic proline-rich protein PRP33-like [Oncorhynchus nerka]